MGLGDIFVATPLAPLVIVLASVSLHLLTIGLKGLEDAARRPNKMIAFAHPLIKKIDFIINKTCFAETEIDAKSFSNILTVAVIMGLIGVTISISNLAEQMRASASKEEYRKRRSNGSKNTKTST